MRRPILILIMAASCLMPMLACGGSAWSMRVGLMRPPTGIAHLGNLELMAFTGTVVSTARPDRGYYTVWLALRQNGPERTRVYRPIVWAHRLFRLPVPPPFTNQMQGVGGVGSPVPTVPAP